MENTLFEKGLKINLLHEHLIIQSNTPQYKSYDGGATGDLATLETIKYLYNVRGLESFHSYNEATEKDRNRFNLFYKQALNNYLSVG